MQYADELRVPAPEPGPAASFRRSAPVGRLMARSRRPQPGEPQLLLAGNPEP